MHPAVTFTFAGQNLTADSSGALYWGAERTLVLSDLHMEKGSSAAEWRTRHLPPYDTRATLACLGSVIGRYDPARVICLGDSFHDLGAFARMDEDDCATLTTLAAGRDWVWITGNHDPLPAGCLQGRIERELTLRGMVFRHQAEEDARCEVSGHYHPKAAVAVGSNRVSGRCFVVGESRLIMPAFGAYTGGLNVLDPAISGLLAEDYHVAIIGRERVAWLPSRKLVA